MTDEAGLRAAAESGEVKAMVDLADFLTPPYEDDPEKRAEAESWFRQAAETGDAGIMWEFGQFLYYDDEQDEAAEWYRKAADLGHAGGMAGLGDYYDFMGDEEECERWYRRAAELGDAGAISNLEALVRMRERG